VGNHQNRAAMFIPNAQQLLLKLLFGNGIQGPEGFIQNQHFWTDGQRTSNGYPLFHPSRNLRGIFLSGFPQPHQIQMFFHNSMLFRLALLGKYRPNGQINIFINREPRQQGIPLKHYHALRARSCNRLPFQLHRATGGLGKSGNHIQQGGFATAGMPNQADKLSLVHTEVDISQDGIIPLGS
jgi:hypothetical protein